MDAEYLRGLFDVDAKGQLIRKHTRSPNAMQGSVAGHVDTTFGYRRVSIDRKMYLAHRLVWLWHYGEWPEFELDHINGFKDDNRIENLRPATHAENQQNKTKQSNNRSGFLGVCWNKQKQLWEAFICVEGKKKWLGTFSSAEAASEAYKSAKKAIHIFQPTERLEGAV
jgi:HNH endonuclease/AP2 domain